MKERFFYFKASIIILIFLCFIFYYFNIISADTLFHWPVNLPKGLSATLGEIRGASLHQGIDIKTNGRSGYPVFASARGRLSRIISGESGYGKAVFLDHGNGRETVYGHLDSFEDGKHNLDGLAKTLKILYNREYLDFRFSGTGLDYQRDEKIAYSGESGSGLPHLHFEIRENNEYLNPLDYIYIKDTTPPVMEQLFVCTERDGTTVYEKKIDIIRKRGAYSILQNPVEAEGDRVFFKISCFDNISAWNRDAVYRIRLYEKKEKKFEIAFDNLKKSDAGYGPFIYDISKSTIDGSVSYVYFLCRREGNDYTGSAGSGNGYITIRNNETELKTISISVSDFAGNEETLKFQFRQKASREGDGFTVMDHKKDTRLQNKEKNIEVTIPKEALHSSGLIRMEYPVKEKTINDTAGTFKLPAQDILNILALYPMDTAYKKPVKIRIKKPQGMDEKDIPHVQIFRFFEGGKPGALNTLYLPHSSEFEAESGTNGFFALIIDKMPPVISLPPTFEFCEDKDVYRKIRLYVKDGISKINRDTIMVIIDGEIYPSSFDEDRKWIEISLPKHAVSSGIHHVFVRLRDKADNEAVFRSLLEF